MEKLRNALEPKLPAILLGLIALQPALDVFSYFLSLRGSNGLSTLLRTALLGAAALLGFALSRRKHLYLAFYAIVAAFWAAHMLNCWRLGYQSVVQDTGSLLRLLNFPLFTMTFVTILRDRPQLRKSFYWGVGIAFGEILLFTFLPWVLGRPVHTYADIGVNHIGVGLIGWFAVPSAQSAIIVLTAPFFIFCAYQSGKYPLYLLGTVLPLGLMFLTGTKLNFYSIFIIAGAYIFLFALQLGKKSLRYVAPLLAIALLAAVFRHQSPMAVRAELTAYSQDAYGSMIADSIGSRRNAARMVKRGGRWVKIVATPDRQLANLRRVMLGIYADEGVYGWRTRDMNQRFGVYNVMDVYDYSDAPGALSDARQMKKNYAKLLWVEKDWPTHLLGFEYSEFWLNGNTYDLENDFPGVFYNTGYLGFGLYLAFLGLFFYRVFRALGGEFRQSLRRAEPGPRGRLKALWQGLRSFLTVELGAVGISFLLAVAAAQISGNVLRRPNATVYFALAAACLFSLTPLPPKAKGEKKVSSEK